MKYNVSRATMWHDEKQINPEDFTNLTAQEVIELLDYRKRDIREDFEPKPVGYLWYYYSDDDKVRSIITVVGE